MSVHFNFLLSVFVTSTVNLMLHAGMYFLFLKDFFARYPVGPQEYVQQLIRPTDELVIWALLLSALAFGFFITTVLRWSSARTFSSGLKYGCVLGFLYWSSINFGLYSAQNIFSLPSTIADIVCSTFAMTISAGVSAWILGKVKTS